MVQDAQRCRFVTVPELLPNRFGHRERKMEHNYKLLRLSAIISFVAVLRPVYHGERLIALEPV